MSPVAPLLLIPVGVVVERRKATSPWADVIWRPIAVLGGLPDAAPWTPLAIDGETATFYAGAAEIELYRSEADNYRENLASAAPAIWVALQETGGDPPYAVAAVTADPAEGEGWTGPGQGIIEAVAMPGPLRHTIAAFVAEHHVERVFKKRTRDRANPEALARRVRGSEATMSDDVSFLARWARRKRDAALLAHRSPKPEDTGDGVAAEEAAASRPPEETPSDFDPASLPPIEAIGPGSDIRPFLAAGVPADLTRAALRRAWSADPAIRHFIGLCENSWDFNAPGGVPGFGSLPEEDARRLLARVMGETEALDPARPAADRLSDDQALVPSSEAGYQAPCSVPNQMKLIREADAVHGNPMPRAETSNVARQHETGERESHPPPPRRRHGGALPD